MTRQFVYGGIIISMIGTAMLAVAIDTHVAQAQTVATTPRVGPSSADAQRMLFARTLFARRVTVTLDHVPLSKAVDAVIANAGVTVSYEAERLDATRKRVTLRLSNVALGDALDQLFAGTPLSAVPVTAMKVAIVSAIPAASVTQGIITGVVLDAVTLRPLSGVSVFLDDASRGVRTDDRGAFRVADVPTGEHRVTTRLIGYAKGVTVARVTDGATTELRILLARSVTALDQVVVTGTVIATELKAVPNAITVITAEELERRGITRIEQLFRGDVPGLFAQNNGSANPLGQVTMYSRGATTFNGGTEATGYKNTNPIKTYVDGVELADPSYLSQIDPRSIARIEILTGPQASTIYGSNAINGVMQIFTKRGSSTRPQLIAALSSGMLQNNFSPALVPQHDYSAQVNGSEGHISYNAGGSWTYTGRWSPSSQRAVTSAFGGTRLQYGPVTADVNMRVSTTQNISHGDPSQFRTALYQSGQLGVGNTGYNGRDNPITTTLDGRTIGLTVGYAPTAWWSNELVTGVDAADTELRWTDSRMLSPSDTGLTLSQTTNRRRSVRYATTARVPVTSYGQLIVTAGADGWRNVTGSIAGRPNALTGSLQASSWAVNRKPGHNAGSFVQTQLGIVDQLFVTYGLRAEWNPNFGDDATPNLAPRYGAAYSHDLATRWGTVTAKLRSSFGRSTRPPATGKTAQTYSQVYATQPLAIATYVPRYGDFDLYLGNPALVPESQQGGEGGLELYFGSRGSLVVTRYNQTVDNLIALVRADSARSLQPSDCTGCYNVLGTDGYGYLFQSIYLNVGSIRNQGWETQGTINAGPLTARGTYSYTKSRVIGVNERARPYLPYSQYQRGAMFRFLPEHTWALGFTYGTGATALALNLSGTGQVYVDDDALRLLISASSALRLQSNKFRMTDSRLNNNGFPTKAYILADVNASRRFTRAVEAIVQVQNITDRYSNDQSAIYATLGRQTKAGLRIRL